MFRTRVCVCTLLVSTSICGFARGEDPFPLRDGDVVAFVGHTFVEREQRDGLIELALTLSAPDANVSFRNLGWSGDTVSGRARRFFGSDEEGFQHLLEHLDLVKPTVILVCYGTSEAFDGESGRAAFLQGYGRLLDELAKRTGRIVLITSPPLDPTASPASDVAKRVNAELRWQAEQLRTLAATREIAFLDLFTPLSRILEAGNAPGPLTDNGLHYTSLGYKIAARVLLSEAGLAPGDAWERDLPAFDQGLSGPEERLRQAIVEKNTLFFHRHRPQNETYLRGFRKHEQGNNAVEIYAFEPLVAEKDREIFAIRKAAAETR